MEDSPSESLREQQVALPATRRFHQTAIAYARSPEIPRSSASSRTTD